jgi:TM2 domain-containing membrane protein YozV
MASDDLQFMLLLEASKKSGALSAALNFFFPGAEYMYCGRVVLGIFVFVFTMCVAIGTFGLGMFLMTPILVIDGFLTADRFNKDLTYRALAARSKQPPATPNPVHGTFAANR